MKSTIAAFAFGLLSQQVSASPLYNFISTDGYITSELIWDGRIRPLFRTSDFDNSTVSPYNAQYVLGTKPWSQVIKFPDVEESIFDKPIKGKSLTVTLDDHSIFQSQTGFRRSELLPSINSGNDATVNGKTAHHFSVRFDPTRPLNYSHEYQPVFIEVQDYSSHVWTLKTGTIFGTTVSHDEARTLKILSSTSSVRPEALLFEVDFNRGWHNFAIEDDWDNQLISVYYSFGEAPLELVVGPVPNDNVGKGQAHFGLIKLPTGPNGIDVTTQGYQENHIDEGLTYGGIFVENTSNVGVTLKPRHD